MKKIALALSLMLVLSACGTPSSEATGKPDGKPGTATQEVKKDDNPKETELSEIKDDTPKGSEDNSSEYYINSINEETAEYHGDCGTGLTWYYKDGVLVIKGTGKTRSINTHIDLATLVQQVIVDEGVTGIGDMRFFGTGTFNGFPNMSKIVLPSTLEEIAMYSFKDCTSLTEITIPNSVTTIGDFAFSSSGITKITIPDSVTQIEDCAFYECDSLTEVMLLASVTEIGDSVFYGCKNLANIIISDSVTKICDWAFYNCENLTEIVIPDSVTQIGNRAFLECKSLTEITIPDSVTEIGDFAFHNCDKLRKILFLGDLPQIGTDIFDDDIRVIYSSPTFEYIQDDYPNVEWFEEWPME